MKESHLFYTPHANADCMGELPTEEAAHAVRVLRMKEGDDMLLTNGQGMFMQAHLTMASPKHCVYETDKQWEDERLWQGEIHIGVAPTKNMDRMEWLAEKATEIGIDAIHLLQCDNSERKVLKTERLEKIVIAAMKQSHKAWKPTIEAMQPFKQFISQPFDGQKFIAHCYEADEADAEGEQGASVHLTDRNFLGDKVQPNGKTLVLIGPEGDFSLEEVKLAMQAGFTPISLGKSRLRTETAALVAVHLLYLAKRV